MGSYFFRRRIETNRASCAHSYRKTFFQRFGRRYVLICCSYMFCSLLSASPTFAQVVDLEECGFGMADSGQSHGFEEMFRQAKLNTSSLTTTSPHLITSRWPGNEQQSVDPTGIPQLAQGTVATHMSDPLVVGAQSTLVLLLNFQDDTSEPITRAEIEDRIFNTSITDSLNIRLVELSYGKAWLTGDVMDWITLPINAADCSTYLQPRSSAFQNTVDFIDPLVDFSIYQHIIVVSTHGNCRGGAVGTQFDISIDTDEGLKNVGLVWVIPAAARPSTLIHELGHTFGFTHQDSLECGDVSVGDFADGCEHIDRGDYYDLMAKSFQGHFSAGNKARIGWFEPQNIAELGIGFHEVALHPLELPSNQIQTIKIPVQYDLFGTSEGVFYFIEYRRPIGLDSRFTELQDPTKGVLIHLQEKVSVWGTQLLDMSPHVTTESLSLADDISESYLVMGETFHDTRHGFSITFDRVQGDTAIIQINIPKICANGTCDPGENSCGCPEDCGPPANIDCTGNGVPDECESDCNNNGVADSCDLANRVLYDCPGGIGNGIPDQCEVFIDCNTNGVLDSCDIANESSTDLNANDIPDDCELHITVYVDLANCPGPGSGSTVDPFCRIQDAIDAQDVNAGINNVVEIIVADGTYTGVGNKDIRFGGRALTLRSENGPDQCIIDMEGVGRGFTFDGQEPPGARLEGFTITHGWDDFQGGGIFCDKYASPTIIDCTVTNNGAQNLGGGISIDNFANPSIIDCRITNNALKSTSITIYGAGIFCGGASPLIHNCLIADNVAVDNSSLARGGGISLLADSHPTITDCLVTRNTAKAGGGISCVFDSNPMMINTQISNNTIVWNFGDGGGIYVDQSNPTIRFCQITGNSTAAGSQTSGGGLYFIRSSGTVESSLIAGNSTGGNGGGVGVFDNNIGHTLHFQNSLIVDNSASNRGGGIYNSTVIFKNTLLIDHCTISGNQASVNGGGLYNTNGNVALTNSILWGNTANFGPELYISDIGGQTSTTEVYYSDIEGGEVDVHSKSTLVWDASNIDLDPGFVDPDGPDDLANTWLDNNYHLRNDSPCKSAGDPNFIVQVGTTDIDGEPRLMGCDNEIGADELWGAVELGSSEQGRRDCNRNNIPDTCEIDLGLQMDCDGDSIPDDCELVNMFASDCNENGILDECEIIDGTSLDVNGNCIPDECLQRPRPVAELTPLDKSRYIAFTPTRAGCSSAIRVTLRSLYHPDVILEGFPDFSALEGEVRWVGPTTEFLENATGDTTFTAAQLQCEPYFGDWGTIDLLHVYGKAILPSSEYEVQMVGDDCADVNDTSCHSGALQIFTGQWGDVSAPFYTPFGSSQPDIGDVLAMVSKWLGDSEPRKAFSQLQPNVLNPGTNVGIADILVTVDAWLGSPYPYAGPTSCP